jgi:hypothetical protein
MIEIPRSRSVRRGQALLTGRQFRVCDPLLEK